MWVVQGIMQEESDCVLNNLLSMQRECKKTNEKCLGVTKA